MMKRSILTWVVAIIVGAAWLGSTGHLCSQEAVAANAMERLMALKAANATLLEKQCKTLQKLDELKEKADQVRIMTHRS